MLERYPARLKDADDITLRGFVQAPRVVLYANSLTDGDKVTHLLLLSFALGYKRQQNRTGTSH